MTIDKLIHLHFLSLYLVILIIFVVAIYVKLKNKKAPKKLSKEKYQSTLTSKMVDKSGDGKSKFNIWPFVNELKRARILSKKTNESELIYKIYKDINDNFEHILLNSENKNNYIVVVVNFYKNKIIGYFSLELKNEYSKDSN